MAGMALLSRCHNAPQGWAKAGTGVSQFPQCNKPSWLERGCLLGKDKRNQLGGGSLKLGAYKVDLI